jgi:hypothetical protein
MLRARNNGLAANGYEITDRMFEEFSRTFEPLRQMRRAENRS